MRRDAAKRIAMAVSRLLGTAAACVVLLSCAAGSRKSYWSGCIKAARVICQQIFFFFNFGVCNFPFKNPFKKCFKIGFISLWRRDQVVELQFPTPLRVVLSCFATQSLLIALYSGCVKLRLLGAAAACVILLSFAAGSRN